jgi:class 3 adenylate cyclase/Tfp pilus assembly protein PilF
VAERRLISVLFADLVGFTTLSESRDAETVRELLSRYFEVASDIIGRYGGTIEKFIGDAVMAVWGAPAAHEDDAERAVRSALDLVEAVRRLGLDVDGDLKLRAGVLTGEAAVTLGATNQGMVAGDLVNTASRLQSIAPPGTVLVGEATFHAASGAIAFEPAGEQVLKGKESPVPAYRALRVVAKRGGAGRSEQLEAPFVGRAPELRMLKDFHAATAAERRPRLVSIMGQGGIGKTRLIWEFQKYIDGVTEVVYWHQGRSPAYGEGISFWALAEMVRSRAGIVEPDDAATSRSKLAAALEESGNAKEAVTVATEAQRLDPRRPEVHNVKGAALAETGNPTAAETEFRAAIALDPRNARAYNNLGNVLRVLGRTAEAAAAYQKAIELAPRYVDPLNGYGVLLVQDGRAAEGRRYLEAALAIAPDFAEARLNRAIALQVAGDTGAAVSELRALVRRLPPGPQRNAARRLLVHIESLPAPR